MPPAAPAALRDPVFLDRIRTRIIEQCEASPIGARLEDELRVEVPTAVGDTFPADLLDGDLPRRILPLPVSRQAAGHQGAGPAFAAPEVWSRVREGVLRDVQSPRPRRLGRGRGIALVGVAAAAFLTALLATEGAKQAPTIVIVDLTAMPAVDFSPMSVIRQGANH